MYNLGAVWWLEGGDNVTAASAKDVCVIVTYRRSLCVACRALRRMRQGKRVLGIELSWVVSLRL